MNATLPQSNIDYLTLAVFIVFFAVFAFLGFYGAKWRKGDLNKLHEWGLGGRRLGFILVWFLMGADLYTAYTFIAVPSAFFAKGAIYFFAVPYVAWGFGVALLTMPKLLEISKKKGYVTAADFIKDKFGSKTLAILIALTGVVAQLPYIALQIVGMQAVLAMLFIGLTGTASSTVTDIALLISFIVLAAFTFTSGLRGAALTAVFKDILIWLAVIVPIVVVVISAGGFSHALAVAGKAAPLYETLAPKEPVEMGYFSLALGSSLALYLYPHAINGSLSAESSKKLKLGTSLLPIYGIGLALLTLFGLLIYAVKPALTVVTTLKDGLLTVPALVAYTMPNWFVGIAFLGIFIGGLVPASIMAIAVANLMTRNVIKEFVPLTEKGEARLAKWISTAFKFIALGFVFVVPATYAIQLQLLGGILVTQTLPSIFLAMYTNKLETKATIAGWAVGIVSAVFLTLYVNKFSTISTTFFSTPLGLIYIALISLALNLLVAGIGSLVEYAAGWRPRKIEQ
ncbi:sodium:solute symporter [Candidatus Acidianus copahuensis]|uniref:Sodium:solute symporter n=1 Tax=Candidatus Acidianus copahuensis TaxID=1160895 RepID=A0A031LSA5_9CREN|nr:sodium:solute symporter [Candidatus Acidianus copahuensis]EZQ10610.1 sodium:solute symporter [Candidatus Acidianus copahuensis]